MKRYLFLHLEAALITQLSPLINAIFFVLDHLFICASRLAAALLVGYSSK
jgi:hypothetical protein